MDRIELFGHVRISTVSSAENAVSSAQFAMMVL
jgi:hypothetical protein